MHESQNGLPSWRKLEFAAVTSVVITLVCVIVGQRAEQVASNAVVEVAQAPKPAPKFNAIDYAATGATGAAKIVIGPCDARHP